MSQPDAKGPLPPDLRFLKILVTTLTVVMILGFLTVIAVVVTRLGHPPAADLAPGFTLPEGVRPQAVTLSETRVLVLTVSDEILLYDRASGALLGRAALDGG